MHKESQNPWDIWNDDRFNKLRRSVLNGSFEYCKGCPVYIAQTASGMVKSEYKPIMERGPLKIMVGDDHSCNLKCWQCRPETKVEEKEQSKRDFLVKVLETFGPAVKELSLLHTGDPFASPTYRPFLQELDAKDHPDLTVNLFTNGLLLPRYWESLRKAHPIITSMVVSIDGATPETYEAMRLGGKWSDLQEALCLIKRLRSLGYLKRAVGRFTVTDLNFREMPSFVRMMHEYGFTACDFGALRVRGFDLEGFREQTVCDVRHPNHREMLSVLEDPWMKHPIVLHKPTEEVCAEFSKIDDEK